MSYQDQKFQPLKYIPVVLIVFGIVASYITLQNRQVNADQRLEKIENRQLVIDTNNTQILVQLSAIQSDLIWVKSALSNKLK